MKVNLKIHGNISGAMRYCLNEAIDEATHKPKPLAEGQKSRAEFLGGQNFGFEIDSAERYEEARLEMEFNALPQNQTSKTRKCENDCLHASLSWEKGQEPSKAEMIDAARSYLKALGMEGAQAAFVAHSDTPHKHIHIIASRIDPATGKTFSQEANFTVSQAWSLHWERGHGQRSQNENRQRLHKIVDAIEARDIPALVGGLTERSPTFTARELDKALSYGMLDKKERGQFKAEILAHQNIIGLQEETQGPVTRYTTREILAGEMALQRDAQRLADDHSHGLSEGRVAATSAAHTLKPEQDAALRHLTGAEGFSMLLGEAGTGKSHTLNAARVVYEAEGVKVVGLAGTHKVVQAMRGDGFTHANTIASELKRLENPRLRGGRLAQDDWNSKTVLIVDEAAMVSTEQLAKLAAAAAHAGAKLILAGDDAQLASIERGGMFETLRQTHGAAVLKDVQRVKDAEQKRAFGEMHEGEFLGALQLAEKAGRLHWTAKQDDTLHDMVKAYRDSVAQSPDKKRFLFAFTNAECDALNEFARVVHKERGDLGADHALATAYGAMEFATGDRVQFAGNGRTAGERAAGLTNGNAGVITGIDTTGPKPRVTVALDAAKGKDPKLVSFVVGEDSQAGEFNKFKRGYAGTIYKGQGATLDETFVAHSNNWKSSAAYVALTRHKESLHIFAARETVKDLEAMAKGMGRTDNRRAASAYKIAERSFARAAFGQAAEETTTSRPAHIPTPPAFILADTGRQAAPVAASARAATGHREASLGKAAAHSVRRTLSGLADGILRALMGESPTPTPRVDRVQAFIDAENAERAKAQGQKAIDALSEVAPINADHARMDKETAEKRDRERRGGGRGI